MSSLSRQHLVIVGGGHAHLHVLRAFAQQRESAATLTLITPEPLATYTGMVPGVIAGQYRVHDAQIDLAGLAASAGAQLVRDRVCAIDPARRRLTLEHHDPIDYDIASFDIGARPAPGAIAQDAPVVWVKPIERAVTELTQRLATIAALRTVVVVGAGAGGIELSFALRARMRDQPGTRVMICDRDISPVAERGQRTAHLVSTALKHAHIEYIGGVDARAVDRDGIRFADGRFIAADLVVWATGAAAPDLFANAALPVDERGFLRVDATLQCHARPELLAAGDCIALENYRLPKAGVFAVRQGPILAANARALVRRVQRLQIYQPQRRFLSLLNTCDGRAVLSYGHVAVHTRWAYTLKDFIDRRFVRSYHTAG